MFLEQIKLEECLKMVNIFLHFLKKQLEIRLLLYNYLSKYKFDYNILLLREPLIINYQEHFSNLSRNFS